MANRFIWSITLFFAFACSTTIQSQSFWFGAKGGGGLGIQRWSAFSPNPKLVWNGDLFIESYSEEGKGSIYAQAGFHQRGSSIRQFLWNGDFFGNQGFLFNNVAVEAGMKKVLNQDSKFMPFYLLGVRGEYNISTNLDDYLRFANPIYPHKDFVRRFVAGVTLGGGFEYTLSEFIKGFLQIDFQPDFTDQYYQPVIQNVINPYPDGPNTITIPERQIRNYGIELKVGIKFLRKVIYY